MLGVQVEEHRVKKERELREKHELKLKLAQDHEFYRVVEKEHADLRRFMVVQNKRELKDQWKVPARPASSIKLLMLDIDCVQCEAADVSMPLMVDQRG